MAVEKLCGLVRIQPFVLAFTLVTWLVWFAATLMYIPYIVLWSPYELSDPDDPDSSRVPGQDYGSGQLSAIVITTGLIVDSFLLAGIHVPYEVNTDMLYPWLGFYGLLIGVMIGVSAALGVMLEGSMKLLAIGPAGVALVYVFMYWCVVQLFLVTNNKKSVIMAGLNQIVMQPLTEKAATAAAAASREAEETEEEELATGQQNGEKV